MKPRREIEKNIEAITQLSSETIDSKDVDKILKKAKIIRNIFLLENLSERRPNIGAISISIILAIEFDTPRYSVRSESIIEEAKYSA